MTVMELTTLARQFAETSPDNRVPEDKAKRPELAGMRIMDAPILAATTADDPYLAALAGSGAMLELFQPPGEWMPEARTVLSFFCPFTEQVRESNRQREGWPSEEWLHGRIEGQAFVFALTRHLQAALEGEGHRTVAPSLDSRFRSGHRPGATGEPGESLYYSSWSERHVAYACGLGTFSLSKGLITERGIAGRFGSLVTDMVLAPTGRRAEALEANCTRCGACAATCPAHAITLEKGKDDRLCDAFCSKVRAAEAPYYGCGKCQTGVPCEARNPARAASQARV